jgi:hypothetical protein
LTIKVTEVIRLDSVGQHAEEKVSWQMPRRRSTKYRLPVRTERLRVEIAQALNLDTEVVRARRRWADFHPLHKQRSGGSELRFLIT